MSKLKNKEQLSLESYIQNQQHRLQELKLRILLQGWKEES